VLYIINIQTPQAPNATETEGLQSRCEELRQRIAEEGRAAGERAMRGGRLPRAQDPLQVLLTKSGGLPTVRQFDGKRSTPFHRDQYI